MSEGATAGEFATRGREEGSRSGPPPGRMREYRTTIDDVPTRVIEVDGSGPPALLLHGFCDSADTWRSVLDRLRYAGRPGLAMDFPGYGHAGLSRRSGNLLQRQVEFAAIACRELAERHGEEVVVAGNSLGGWTMLRLAERADLPIRGIVPIAPAGLEMSPWFFRLDAIPGAARLINLPAPVPERFVRQTIERALRARGFGARERIDEGFVRAFASHNRSRARVRRRVEDARGVIGELKRPYDPAAIDAPAVVVWGDRDRLCIPSGAAPLAERLGAPLRLIERCGHLPQVETPDEVVGAIAELAGPVGRL